MEEMIALLKEIRDLLEENGRKLDDIQSAVSDINGIGLYNNLADVCDKLEQIKGDGLYKSLSDVCDKLGDVENAILLQ